MNKIYYKTEYYKIMKDCLNWSIDIDKKVKQFMGFRGITRIGRQSRRIYVSSERPLEDAISQTERYLKEYFIINEAVGVQKNNKS